MFDKEDVKQGQYYMENVYIGPHMVEFMPYDAFREGPVSKQSEALTLKVDSELLQELKRAAVTAIEFMHSNRYAYKDGTINHEVMQAGTRLFRERNRLLFKCLKQSNVNESEFNCYIYLGEHDKSKIKIWHFRIHD